MAWTGDGVGKVADEAWQENRRRRERGLAGKAREAPARRELSPEKVEEAEEERREEGVDGLETQ